jgi:pimeloyl-ACP methyl ester carboxylesterase
VAPSGGARSGGAPSAVTADPGSDRPEAPETPGIVWVTHGAVQLALHCLRPGEGRPLLLLHGLGEHTPAEVPRPLAGWPGPVWGLDFTGHGASTVPAGGGYTAEVLMADADHALAHLGAVTVVGRGLGSYVAMLVAGGRPRLVTGAILTDGPGLAGGGPTPASPAAVRPALDPDGPGAVPDPYALVELVRDVRPGDYAATFARHAAEHSGLETPITVTGVVRPPWLAAVVDQPGVAVTTLPEALAHYATVERPRSPVS